MNNFFSKIGPILAVSDLNLVIAQDGENITIQALPKAKHGDVEFPSLMFSGTPKEFDDAFVDALAEKMNKSMPLVSNIITFDKNLADLETKKKEDLSKKKNTPAAKPSLVDKTKAKLAEMKEEEDDGQDDEKEKSTEEENVEEQKQLEAKQPEPQKSLF